MRAASIIFRRCSSGIGSGLKRRTERLFLITSQNESVGGESFVVWPACKPEVIVNPATIDAPSLILSLLFIFRFLSMSSGHFLEKHRLRRSSDRCHSQGSIGRLARETMNSPHKRTRNPGFPVSGYPEIHTAISDCSRHPFGRREFQRDVSPSAGRPSRSFRYRRANHRC